MINVTSVEKDKHEPIFLLPVLKLGFFGLSLLIGGAPQMEIGSLSINIGMQGVQELFFVNYKARS